MRRFLISQVLHRRGRTLTLAVGILVAAVSFTLLTSAARTSQLTVKRSVAENFRPAYDILVRPPDSFSPLERKRELIRENYLSGIYGGISVQQWRRIKRLAGVEVAAPIANVGYIMPFRTIPVAINRYLNDDDHQLYRLRFSWEANGGVSRYPDSDQYLYYTRNDRLIRSARGPLVQTLPDGRKVLPCSGFYESAAKRTLIGPFTLRAREGIVCYSRLDLGRDVQAANSDPPLQPGTVGVQSSAFFPVFISAIDPVEEQKLLDLNDTIVTGRPLRRTDTLRTETIFRFQGDVIPVIGSARTFVDETLRIDVERLTVPGLVDLPERLGQPRNTDRFVRSLDGEVVGTQKMSLDPLYDRLIDDYSVDPTQWKTNLITYDAYWSGSEAKYELVSTDRLRPATAHNDPALTFSGYYGSGWAPQENADVNFRTVERHGMINEGIGTSLHVVGRFDPALLPGFSELSEVPLETYYPPELEGADPRSRRLLGGRPLRPTQSIVDYIAQPPMMLTTINAMEGFRDPANFQGTFDDEPISVIRVRVAGVTGPDRVSRERIKNVAGAIRQRTGLSVDITAGSSPTPMLIELPKGRFGRPELLLEEGWVEKGVAVRFLDAIDKKSVILFGLILVICGFFLANAAYASVRARRSELGTLMCLGWSRPKIFGTVLGELAVIGLVAGVAGSLLAAWIVAAFDLDLALARTLLVAPTATLLAILAGLLPALNASRGTPLSAVTPVNVAPRRPRPVKGMVAMARANLLRAPARTIVGCLGLVLGVGALTLLLALNNALQGTLVGTLLGNFISVQVRTVDIVSVVLVILLGAASIADVLFLNLRERAPEFATLSTSGWTTRNLATVALSEGLGMALAGSVVGAGLGLGIVAFIRGVAVAPSALVAVLVTVGAILVTLLACVGPVTALTRLKPTIVLAEE